MRVARLITFLCFIGCIFGANWALNRYGFVQLVGPGDIVVPAGVYFAGLAFGFRDALHEVGGRKIVLVAIAVGAMVSFGIEPDFALASGVAFGFSELADFAVYDRLRQKRWTGAVVLSNIVGSIIDSLIFLQIAFSSTDGWADLTYGKALMIVPAIVMVGVIRKLKRVAF